MLGKKEEFDIKCGRVRDVLESLGLDAALIGNIGNFAWLGCGADNYVGTATQVGSAYFLVTQHDIMVLSDNIERPRIEQEALEELDLKYVTYPWYESDLMGAIHKKYGDIAIGSDIPLPGTKDISAKLKSCRYPLLPVELTRYLMLGKVVGGCLEHLARLMKPGMSENQAMATLSEMLLGNGIVPTCSLAAFDERILRYRHPLPTNNRLVKTAMLITGARKWGLIVSATRVVSIGKPSKELKRKHRCVCEVDASFISSTRPGANAGEIFRKATQIYAEHGFADEWKLHHQGGATGYEAREFKATPTSEEVVTANTAYAWNPSVTGTKSEDTILVLDDSTRIISASDDWPKVTVDTENGKIERPDILVL